MTISVQYVWNQEIRLGKGVYGNFLADIFYFILKLDKTLPESDVKPSSLYEISPLDWANHCYLCICDKFLIWCWSLIPDLLKLLTLYPNFIFFIFYQQRLQESTTLALASATSASRLEAGSTLTCHSSAPPHQTWSGPRTTVSWKLSDRVTETTTENHSVLACSSAERNDQGSYQIKLDNSRGTDNFSVKVTVLGKFVCSLFCGLLVCCVVG